MSEKDESYRIKMEDAIAGAFREQVERLGFMPVALRIDSCCPDMCNVHVVFSFTAKEESESKSIVVPGNGTIQ